MAFTINGSRIKRLREKKGWEIRDLARCLYLSEVDIAKVEEHGESNSGVVISRLRKWAEEEERRIEREENNPMRLVTRDVSIQKLIDDLTGMHEKKKDLIPSTLGEKLRQLREKKGVSKSKVSKILGASYSSIIKWESDESRPNKKSMEKLAAYYDVKVSSLKKYLNSPKTNGGVIISAEIPENDYIKFSGICKTLSMAPDEMMRRMVKNFDFERYYKFNMN